MAQAKDYPVTFPYGATTAPYSPSYPHKGDDRAMPVGTSVRVNGVQIGNSGKTGFVTGPHLHVGKWLNGRHYNPGGKGFSFNSAVVTQIDPYDNDANGKFVRVQADGYSWVYLHLSEITCKVGQKLVAPVAAPTPLYTRVLAGEGLSHIARRVGYRDWWSPTAWVRLSKLNGYGLNWIAYNRSLQPGQKIRYR